MGDSVIPALLIQDVSHRYKDLLAIDRLSLEIPAGKIFGILGPNGSGKSTLFRLVSTLAAIQSGKIEVSGFNVSTQTDQVRQQLGVVFQSPSLDRKLTVLENIRCQAALYGLSGSDRDKRIDACVQRLGLSDKLGVRCEKLSGGQKRRVELAKGLIHSPSVLLMDEPSTGLDPAARLDLWQSLTELREEHGTTVILTTHLLEEADKCDAIAILNTGSMVACDRPENLRAETGEVVVCIATNDPAAVARALLERLQMNSTLLDQQVRIATPDAMNSLAAIIDVTKSLSTSVTIGRPSLEDVFISKTGHQFLRS